MRGRREETVHQGWREGEGKERCRTREEEREMERWRGEIEASGESK